MHHKIEEIKFGWSTLDDLGSNLQKVRLAYQPSAEIFDGHCAVLERLAINLNATKVARRNAHGLANGYRDLAMLTHPGACRL